MTTPPSEDTYPTRAEIEACVARAETLRSTYARDIMARAARGLADLGQTLITAPRQGISRR